MLVRFERALSQSDILWPQRTLKARNYTIRNYDRCMKARKYFGKSENIHVVIHILGRSDRTLGAIKSDSLNMEVLRSECPDVKAIFGQYEGAPRAPRSFECFKGSGLGAQKWRTERYSKTMQKSNEIYASPPENTPINGFEMCPGFFHFTRLLIFPLWKKKQF